MKLAPLILGLSLGAACGGDDDTGSTTTSSTTSATVTCQHDARVMTYSAKMAQVGDKGLFQVVLDESDPAPPGRGTNTWAVRVLDAQGMPVTGSTLAVDPFMPDHGHGTSVKPVVTAGADGSFTITPLYLFMPGVWRIRFTVTTPSDSDTVEFWFCVAG